MLLDRVAREGLTEKVTLKQTSEELSEKPLWILGHDHSRHRDGKYKDPNRDQLGMFQYSREASMAGAEGVRGAAREEVRALPGQITHSPGRHEDGDFHSEWGREPMEGFEHRTDETCLMRGLFCFV